MSTLNARVNSSFERSRRFALGLWGFALAALMVPPNVAVAGPKGYPASLCVGQNWPQSSRSNAAGALHVTQSGMFYCPAVAHRQLNTAGLSRVRVYLNQPPSPAPNSTCTLAVYNTGGGLTASYNVSTSGSGNQFLSITNINSSPTYAQYSLNCTFSAGTTVYTYQITER